MKLFSRFIRKSKKSEMADLYETKKGKENSGSLNKQRIDFSDKNKREQFVLDCCEQILKSSRIMESSKMEYQQIITNLSDAQQIENLPEEQKNDILITARNISRINRERKKFQTSDNLLTDGQYLQFEKFENEIPVAIGELEKKEKYLRKIKSDMQHLEGEKGALSYRRKGSIKSQMNLKGLSMIAFITLIIVFSILVGAQVMFDLKTQIGYLVSAFTAGLVALGIFLKNRWNIYTIKKSELDMNKTIQLLNRIKIKYVNITNEIEYVYEKYRINSSHEFNYLWQMYIKEKQQKEKYIRTSKDLELFSEELLRKLEQFNIKDSGIWLYHTDSIVDTKKMNDLTQELQKKERELRKRIDDNLEQAESAKRKITEFVNTHREYGKETLELVNSVDSMEGIC